MIRNQVEVSLFGRPALMPVPLNPVRRVLVVGETCALPILPAGALVRVCRSYDEARTMLFRVQAGLDAPYDAAFIQRTLPDGDGAALCGVFEKLTGGTGQAVLTLP